eukprot:CFRG7346T1
MTILSSLASLAMLLLMEKIAWHPPSTPKATAWADQVHATLLQNRSGVIANVHLYYDWINKRNLNVINDGKSVLFDNERQNGSTYYYYPMARNTSNDCTVIDMKVGILKPDYMFGGKYHGRFKIYSYAQKTEVWADYWTQDGAGHHPFIFYYHDVLRNVPVMWKFFDNATFDVLSWDASEDCMKGKQVEQLFQIPSYCFSSTRKITSVDHRDISDSSSAHSQPGPTSRDQDGAPVADSG